MPEVRPSGATSDAQYVFSKIFVHDLDEMASFYEAVFGLVRFNRHQDQMLGRAIDEISYQSTYPGGSALTLIKYMDSRGPSNGESVQGFTTTDINALVERAKAAGGTIPEVVRRIEEFGLHVVFVLDPEGHINEVVQLDAQ
jgi:predicted enzyme related to lactoylglutathione lyase